MARSAEVSSPIVNRAPGWGATVAVVVAVAVAPPTPVIVTSMGKVPAVV